MFVKLTESELLPCFFWSVSLYFHINVFAAPAFPVQAFPNGYPGYPIRGDSSQPSLADDQGHSLMGLEDQVRPILAP